VPSYKVTIHPEFLGTVPKIKVNGLILTYFPLLLQFYSTFVIIFIRMENPLGLVSNCPKDVMKTVLCMEQ